MFFVTWTSHPPSISFSHCLQWEANDLYQLQSCCVFLPISTMYHYWENCDCLLPGVPRDHSPFHQSTFLPIMMSGLKFGKVETNVDFGVGWKESFHGHISHLEKEFSMSLEDTVNPPYCLSSALWEWYPKLSICNWSYPDKDICQYLHHLVHNVIPSSN